MNGRGRIIMYSVIDIIRATTPFVFGLFLKTTKEKKIYIQKVKTIAILLIFFDIKAYNIKR